MCLPRAQCWPRSQESCPGVAHGLERGQTQGPSYKTPRMYPLKEYKWGPSGEDLIQGEKLRKSYPGVKGWEGCPT